MNETETITVRVDRSSENGKAFITFTVAEDILKSRYTPVIMEEVVKRVIEIVAQRVADTHGPEIIEKLSPGTIEREVKRLIAERILK